MAVQDIQIVDVRSLNEAVCEIVDITEYDSDDLPASVALKRSYPNNREFTKPAISYSVLISLAFKNAEYGRLTDSQIYSFINEHFPYYLTATKSWKSTVRQTLCKSPYFMRMTPRNSVPYAARCTNLTWAVNPAMMVEMENLIARSAAAARQWAKTSMNDEEDITLLLEGRIAEKGCESVEVIVEDDDTEDRLAPDEVIQPKPLVFTQYKDGFPLVTLYSETPGDYEGYAAKYPVKF